MRVWSKSCKTGTEANPSMVGFSVQRRPVATIGGDSNSSTGNDGPAQESAGASRTAEGRALNRRVEFKVLIR